MSRIVLTSFADLASVLQFDQPFRADHDVSSGAPCQPDIPPDAPLDLDALLRELQSASKVMAEAAQQDARARASAEEDLAAYDAAVARHQDATNAVQQASRLRQQAEDMVRHGFDETARTTARQALDLAVHAAEAADALGRQTQVEVDPLGALPAVHRLLAERRRDVEAAQAQAAEAERTRRLGEALTAVRAALSAGNLEDARAMVGHLAKEHPTSADVTSLQHIIRQRVLTVKTDAAEEALRAARRLSRRQPAEAAAHLEALDLTGLPEPLLRQLVGIWLCTCGRLCRERGVTGLLRFLPEPGHGVVVARERDEAPYTVVSALGNRSPFSAGHVVDDAFVRTARPLRAGNRA